MPTTQRKITYGTEVYDLAYWFAFDQASAGNEDMHTDTKRYADDLAQEIQQAVEDWIQARIDSLPLRDGAQ